VAAPEASGLWRVQAGGRGGSGGFGGFGGSGASGAQQNNAPGILGAGPRELAADITPDTLQAAQQYVPPDRGSEDRIGDIAIARGAVIDRVGLMADRGGAFYPKAALMLAAWEHRWDGNTAVVDSFVDFLGDARLNCMECADAVRLIELFYPTLTYLIPNMIMRAG